MIIQKTFRYRLEPTWEQGQIFARFAGCCRHVFNMALAARKLAYEQAGKTPSFVDPCKALTEMKKAKGTAWLAEVHSQVLEDLDAAYQHFFRRVKQGPAPGFPRFKKKGFFVCLSCEIGIQDPVHPSTSAVGIDVGVVNFASLSDGTQIEPLDSFRKHEARLARAQRKLSRKRKASRNFKKLEARVRRLQTHVADSRKDFLHKISTSLCKNHAVIVIEDLDVKGMSASARGSVEVPGSNVRAESGLNKSIFDQGWGMFRSIHCGHADHADENAARNILRAGLARLACLAAKVVESQAQGSNLLQEVLAGTALASAMPGIPRL